MGRLLADSNVIAEQFGLGILLHVVRGKNGGNLTPCNWMSEKYIQDYQLVDVT